MFHLHAKGSLGQCEVKPVDVTSCCIQTAQLISVNLPWLSQTSLYMCGDYMCGAYMCGAYMCGAYMCGAYMCGAYMCGAYMCGAYMCGAYMMCGACMSTCSAESSRDPDVKMAQHTQPTSSFTGIS